MAGHHLKPRVSRKHDIIQLSYELPHRTHTAKVYPVPSPNGSTIIIYGHEHGLQVLWRGGRPFKRFEKPKADESKVNGTSSDAIMIIDSDDEEPTKPTEKQESHNDGPIYEDDEEEFDPSEPYPPILQDLNLMFGTDVLHLSFLNLPSEKLPPIFSHKLVVAVACADCTVRIITLPLTPPSPASKAQKDLRSNDGFGNVESGRCGEQVLILGNNTGHRTIPNGVSMSITPRHNPIRDSADMDEDEDDDNPSHPVSSGIRPSASRSRSRIRQSTEENEWDLLLASHSPEISGLLLLYRIPIITEISESKTEHLISTEHILPFQTQYLPSPASNISFNPSLYPARRHPHLLVTDTKGGVRIYECFPPQSRDRSSSGQRSSVQERPDVEQGSWLISLYPGFESSKQPGSTPNGLGRRKQIVNAQWCLGGKGVIVLLSDGEWGVWDIEGAGPGAKKGPLQGEGNRLGVQGGALTQFSIRGQVDGSLAESSTLGRSSTSESKTSSKLAPMTPGTRRVREEVLFSGPSAGITSFSQAGICVTRTAGQGPNKQEDEALLFWHEGNVVALPSMLAYWQKEINGGGGSGSLFTSGRRDRPSRIDGLNLYGELNNGVDQFPQVLPNNADTAPSQPEILVALEHRLVILMTARRAPSRSENMFQQQPEEKSPVDQQLLARGELDVSGMDRMLASMANGDQRNGTTRNGAIGKRKVGFVS
ncbi:MAG: hypothetical protein M1827_000098 [Pycnora praestabilis]|nr:MAG: hypothetical protein M1827_000098 [Pycnora praestabilis]